jgi:hypothetical protein
MNDLTKIAVTSCATIVGGVIVFVVGQLLSKFFIEPIHDFRRIIADVGDQLIFHAQVYCNPSNDKNPLWDEASYKLRQMSSLLRIKQHVVPCYSFWSKIRIVPTIEKINEAARGLMYLSNSVYAYNQNGVNQALKNSEQADTVKQCLGLPN